MKDTVTRTERKLDDAALKVDDNTEKLCELERRFDEHLTGEG